MQQPYKLSEELSYQFQLFIENHALQPFSNFLRDMTLGYLQEELKHSSIPNIDEFLSALSSWFCLLDAAVEEVGMQNADNAG